INRIYSCAKINNNTLDDVMNEDQDEHLWNFESPIDLAFDQPLNEYELSNVLTVMNPRSISYKIIHNDSPILQYDIHTGISNSLSIIQILKQKLTAAQILNHYGFNLFK